MIMRACPPQKRGGARVRRRFFLKRTSTTDDSGSDKENYQKHGARRILDRSSLQRCVICLSVYMHGDGGRVPTRAYSKCEM
ncbi:unnamed protein product [Amoebophrya sp. A120]|nr:unnamed protein product [Amoebophrya sp. A120]|eukprot:GSA120T00009542001.1